MVLYESYKFFSNDKKFTLALKKTERSLITIYECTPQVVKDTYIDDETHDYQLTNRRFLYFRSQSEVDAKKTEDG
jgi:hypothetical protein